MTSKMKLKKVETEKEIFVKETENYGDNLFIIKVPKSVSESEEIAVRGDGVEVGESGSLTVFYFDSDGSEIVTFSISPNNWKTFYLADEKFQHPVSVERWPGIAGVKIIETPVSVDKEFVEKEVPVFKIFEEDGSCKFCGRVECELTEEQFETIEEIVTSVEKEKTE